MKHSKPHTKKMKAYSQQCFSLRFLDVFVGEIDPNLLKTLCNATDFKFNSNFDN